MGRKHIFKIFEAGFWAKNYLFEQKIHYNYFELPKIDLSIFKKRLIQHQVLCTYLVLGIWKHFYDEKLCILVKNSNISKPHFYLKIALKC